MYFSANEVPFGAKGSQARKEFMRKEYNKPRTLKSAGTAPALSCIPNPSPSPSPSPNPNPNPNANPNQVLR